MFFQIVFPLLLKLRKKMIGDFLEVRGFWILFLQVRISQQKIPMDQVSGQQDVCFI